MKAIVLAGGLGTRLRPLTASLPKQMLPIAEVAMIERVLGRLSPYGIDEAVLSLGYEADAFARAYPDGFVGGLRLSYAVEPEPLDTAGGIAFAARSAGIVDTFLVVNADVLTDLNVADLVSFHKSRAALATIHLTPVADPSAFGVVPTGPTGRVVDFIEKPPPGTAPTNLINAGTYVLEPEVLDLVPASTPTSIERETFPLLAKAGSLFGFASDDYWLDTGTPANLLQANMDMIDGTRGLPPAPGARQAAPGVWYLAGPARVGVRPGPVVHGEPAQAGEPAASGEPVVHGELQAPCLIGAEARVAARAFVQRCVVGAGVIVSEGARLISSVVMAGAEIGPGAVVSSSIVGPGALIGRGATVGETSVVGPGASVAAGATVSAGRVS
ncbi:MAG: sugar phosphate nucleotidyltransferase [Acidimicrobiales bacterium]